MREMDRTVGDNVMWGHNQQWLALKLEDVTSEGMWHL